MRILLTGATGFIGKQLLPMLSTHQVLVVDISRPQNCGSEYDFFKGDLFNVDTYAPAVIAFAPQACIHLAWKGLPDYSLFACLENFNMTLRLYNILEKCGCKKVITAGTCWEYGSLKGCCKETDLPGQMNLFASFKTAIRSIGESMAILKSIQFIWARIFFIYGPGQRETSLIPTCIKALQSGRMPEIKNPQALNDFIHIVDVAKALVALVETANINGIFNICSGAPTKVADIFTMISRYTIRSNALSLDTEFGVESGFWGDNTRIQTSTTWKPEILLDDGIRDLIAPMSK